jgi:hypothetical protein
MSTSAAASPLGHIKGAAFREFVVWYALRFGRRELLRSLPPSHGLLDRAANDLGVLANVWYPAELVHELVDGMVVGLKGAELDAIAQDAANQIMNKTLRGVYRALFNLFVTPDRYARHVGKLWSVHYDTGRPVVEQVANNEHLIRYVDWASHHGFICRLNMAAAVPIYTAMGCRDVSWSRVSCRSLQGLQCMTRVRWRI